ncbi:MAG: orotidine-5'-phosphate decarboxylase [Melioribacteraceae bacterium]|nr:orotidine-5'-phosphate decarboxylase [Melioribacteraceae bacterium]
MTAQQKLKNKIENGLHLCVGLDTDITKIPKHLFSSDNPVTEFNKIIIENTYEHAAAYKINFAFYEKDGSKGLDNILETLTFFPSKDPLLIADAKRGDIGNTSQMYAKSVFEHFGFDAVTLHPYMGFDSLEPFLNYSDKINFILALTSNPGSNDFEKLKLEDGQYLYQKVIKSIKEWNKKNNCGIVFGATNLSELQSNIKDFGEMPVLLPGFGSQGGNLEEVVRTFYSNNNNNFIINVSRALIYCNGSPGFGKNVSDSIQQLNEEIKKII